MKKFYCLALFFFMVTVYLSGEYIWAQPLPGSEGQSYETIDNDDGPARGTGDKEESGQINEEPSPISDPIEGYNRVMFTVNDKAYFYAFKPLANGYRVVLPERARISVKNLFYNIRMPIRLVNCLLQGKLKGAGAESLRFVINSTIGVAGLFDPAKSYFCLETHWEDFGQTLGRYGMGPVFYIQWPFLGPSSLRDTLGFVGDTALDPLTYLFLTPVALYGSSYFYDYINTLSLDKDTYEGIVEPAIDPYLAVQDAYIQNRDKWIKE